MIKTVEAKARRQAQLKRRYATDPVYRQQKISKDMAYARTKKGRIQSCLRISNHAARKGGWAECPATAQEVMKAFTGICKLCGTQDTALVIDHCHTTGRFRGWLCNACNSGLGYFKDNPATMRKAMEYVYTLDDTSKETNPKDTIGAGKAPIHLWPQAATAVGSMGLLDGALKYGRNNWRVAGIKASIYYDAISRHLAKWFEGEDTDPDSGLPHEAHLLACLAIIVDAKAAGKFVDDRGIKGDGYLKLLKELTPHVKRLKELYKDKAPHHYSKLDECS